MKKFLFGFLAIVMITSLCYGQNNDPSNPDNEFDYVGKIHNEALVEIISSTEAKNMFARDSKNYCLNLLSENKIESRGYILAIEDEKVSKKLGEFNNNVTMYTQEQIQSWYNEKYINENIKTYLITLSLITEKYYKNFNYSAFKSDIIKLEEQAYSYKNDDKVFIL